MASIVIEEYRYPLDSTEVDHLADDMKKIKLVERVEPAEPYVLKTKNVMTRYEKASLIIYRANHLATGATPLVEYTGDFDAIKIAREEVDRRLLKNLVIRRALPDGSFEDISSADLIICH